MQRQKVYQHSRKDTNKAHGLLVDDKQAMQAFNKDIRSKLIELLNK